MKQKLEFYINGEWVEGDSPRPFDVINPADERVLASVASAEIADADAALDAAEAAMKDWAARTPRDQDAVSVLLDARPAPARDANPGIFRARKEGALGRMVLAWVLPGEARADPLVGGFLPELPPGTRRAARTTARGYDVELAIPAAALDERQGGPWQGFRLNVSLQDHDAGGGSVVHWWRPSRFGLGDVTTVVGSGTFVRDTP